MTVMVSVSIGVASWSGSADVVAFATFGALAFNGGKSWQLLMSSRAALIAGDDRGAGAHGHLGGEIASRRRTRDARMPVLDIVLLTGVVRDKKTPANSGAESAESGNVISAFLTERSRLVKHEQRGIGVFVAPGGDHCPRGRERNVEGGRR